jgi:transcriptional regulator with XRE-family HTH domain
MENKNNPIADKLKQLMFEHDLTPTELARRVEDIPQQTIQRIVKGKIKKPHAKTLETIANYFNFTPNDLTKGDDHTDFFSDALNTSRIESKPICVYSWEQLDKLFLQNDTDNTITPSQEIIVMSEYNTGTFGVIMPDSSMSPYFAKGSILIIEPSTIKAEDRSFVLTHIDETNKFLFRQLLIDGGHYVMKALSSDLSTFPIRKMENNEKLIGNLVETRQTYSKNLGVN